MQWFDTLFPYTFQEGPKLNLLNIDTIQGKYVIIINQTDHIMKNIVQEYGGTKKIWGNISAITFSSWHIISLSLKKIWNKLKNQIDDPSITGLVDSHSSLFRLAMI